MEVHAHTHTARKKWTHYFWEFIMLFLAVFCGFLAENQREHIIEHSGKNNMPVLYMRISSQTQPPWQHLSQNVGYLQPHGSTACRRMAQMQKLQESFPTGT